MAKNIEEYRQGYEAGRAATPLSQLADGFFALLDSKDFNQGYRDGLERREWNPDYEQGSTSGAQPSTYSTAGLGAGSDVDCCILGGAGCFVAVVFVVVFHLFGYANAILLAILSALFGRERLQELPVWPAGCLLLVFEAVMALGIAVAVTVLIAQLFSHKKTTR